LENKLEEGVWNELSLKGVIHISEAVSQWVMDLNPLLPSYSHHGIYQDS